MTSEAPNGTLREIQREVASLQKELRAVRRERDKLQHSKAEETERLRCQAASLKKENVSVRQERDQWTMKMGEQRAEIDHLRGQLASVEEKLERSTMTTEEQRAENTHLRGQLASVEEKLERSTMKTEEQRAENKHLCGQLASAEEKLERSTMKTEEQQAEIDHLRGQVNDERQLSATTEKYYAEAIERRLGQVAAFKEELKKWMKKPPSSMPAKVAKRAAPMTETHRVSSYKTLDLSQKETPSGEPDASNKRVDPEDPKKQVFYLEEDDEQPFR